MVARAAAAARVAPIAWLVMGASADAWSSVAAVTPNLPTAMSSLVGGVTMLLVLSGPLSLLGVAMMVSCLLISAKLTKYAKTHIGRALHAADGRVAVKREIVEGIKVVQMSRTFLTGMAALLIWKPTFLIEPVHRLQVVKMAVWEEAYIQRLDGCRANELTHHRRFRLVTLVCIALGRVSPMLGATLVFAVYSRTHTLDASIVFPTLSIFVSMRLPL